jgi:hypothetical protein
MNNYSASGAKALTAIPGARRGARRGTVARPFGDSGLLYRERGWPGEIAVSRHGAKAPLMSGVTGHEGADLDDEELARAVIKYARASIGLRLPWDILGLDVDAYDGRHGGRTLRELERRLGPLPETWRSTSRAPEDSVSGIYLYWAPREDDWVWIGDLGVGNGIEIIQWHHRFVTVWPSRHNSTGQLYRWWRGTEEAGIPSPDDLPRLPVAWARYLRSSARYSDKVSPGADDAVTAEWWERVAPGPMCDGMREAGERGAREIARASQHKAVYCLHDTMTAVMTHLCRLASEGHRGLGAALEGTGRAFTASSRRRDLHAEWSGALNGYARAPGAKSKAAAREQSFTDPCEELRGLRGPRRKAAS